MIFSAKAYATRNDDVSDQAQNLLDLCSAELRKKVEEARKKLDSIVETVELYKFDREYSAERSLIHAKILGGILVEDALIAATPRVGPPTYVMLGGRGGSGKSWFNGKAYDPAKSIVIDPDVIKALLPEYAGWNAAAVHEESSDIAEVLLTVARALKINVVLDVTMRTRETAISKVNAFKRDGYIVEAHFMYLPRHKAALRALQRFAAPDGRFVPPEVILGNVTNEETFDDIKALADRWSFWSSDVDRGEEPICIAHHGPIWPLTPQPVRSIS